MQGVYPSRRLVYSFVAPAALLLLGSPPAVWAQNSEPAAPVYYFTTYAGGVGSGGTADGDRATARFFQPKGVAVASDGTVYVGDRGAIRKIAPDGTVTTLTGAGHPTYVSSPNTYTGHSPDGLYGLCVAPSVGGLVFGDFTAVRRITTSDVLLTVAGGGTVIQSLDGTGVNAFLLPAGIGADPRQNIIVADTYLSRIRQVTLSGVVTTVAGPAPLPVASLANLDGPAAKAIGFFPWAVAIDAAGTTYFVETITEDFLLWFPSVYKPAALVRKLTPDHNVKTIAGDLEVGYLNGKLNYTTIKGGYADGTGTEARFGCVPAMAMDLDGSLLVVDRGNNRIRRVTTAGVVTTVAGSADGYADGVGAAAHFGGPSGIAVATDGTLFIADTQNQVIRKGVRVAAPAITAGPRSQPAVPGQALSLTVSYTSNAPAALQWFRDGVALAGETGDTLALANVQSTSAGNYTVTVANAAASVTSAAALITVGSAPAITAQPTAQSILGGQGLVLSVTVSGTPAPAFQWRKDGVTLPGATNLTYTVTNAQSGDAGTYSVVVTNAAGTVTSSPVLVAVNTSRITNLSILGSVGPQAPILTVGFSLSGSDKQLLVRAAGPALRQFGMSDALMDPKLTLYGGGTALGSNERWDSGAGAANMSETMTKVGAFAFGSGSGDAALARTFGGGGYSAQITSSSSAAGKVLVELYDTDASTAARLNNVSAAAQIGVGKDALVAGFVLTGNARKTLLIRGTGPALAALGVPGVLSDPRLEVLGANNAVFATNDDWGGSASINAACRSVGAFELTDNASKDAALLVALDPGSYTVQLTGATGAAGFGLIEIYEVP